MSTKKEKIKNINGQILVAQLSLVINSNKDKDIAKKSKTTANIFFLSHIKITYFNFSLKECLYSFNVITQINKMTFSI